ncbi:hypothetical protein V6N13_026372 [Hibiscus sabdariffa]|uniref:RING-type domain-containing protein n=1 Tax=Hibiscus sabdariffa TaxID=183260 RepID=A0ABR2P6F9_9ROSI
MKIIKTYLPNCMFFLSLVNYVKLLLNKAFTALRLLETQPSLGPEEDYRPGDGYILLTYGRSRSIIPVPVQVLMAMIKHNLPVLEYGDFAERFGDGGDEQVKNGEDDRVCRVCLESMEKNDEMRQLCMCSHVFHRQCIDTWVDEGRVTCPLCRSTLYPDPMVWSRPGIRPMDSDLNS